MPLARSHAILIALALVAVPSIFLVPVIPATYPPAHSMPTCPGSVSVDALCSIGENTMASRGSLSYFIAGYGGVFLANSMYELYLG
jgi:hypothetical protein